MDLLDYNQIASVTLFELRLSEGELMVYDACIRYVLSHCPEDKLYNLTGCEDSEELKSLSDELAEIIKEYVLKEYLPPEYK